MRGQVVRLRGPGCATPRIRFDGISHTHRHRSRQTRGKPIIRGLRITVYDVLDYLASGMTEAQILDDFPELEPEDIRACLAFAADRERKLVSGA